MPALFALDSAVDFARLGVAFARVEGTRQVGVGSRDGYRGTIAALELDVLRFPWARLGLEIGGVLQKVALPSEQENNHGRLWAGASVAAFRSSAGSVIVGLGPGVEIGPRVWWTEKARGYVDASLRLRWFPAEGWALHGNVRHEIASGDRPDVSVTRCELLFGRSLGFLGVRYERMQVESGIPSRVYVDHLLGVSLSLGVHG